MKCGWLCAIHFILQVNPQGKSGGVISGSHGWVVLLEMQLAFLHFGCVNHGKQHCGAICYVQTVLGFALQHYTWRLINLIFHTKVCIHLFGTLCSLNAEWEAYELIRAEQQIVHLG